MSDYTDESAMMLSVLSGDAVAVTRAGSLALLPQGVKRIPMASRTYVRIAEVPDWLCQRIFSCTSWRDLTLFEPLSRTVLMPSADALPAAMVVM